MEGEKKIVVAIDESEESMYALSWCLNNIIVSQQISKSTTLVLLYVKPPPPAYSAFDVAGYLFGNDGIATLEEYSKKLVDSVMSKAQAVCMKSNRNVYFTTNNILLNEFYLFDKIKVEKKVGSGDAKNVICGTVEKLGADMLVMGSHGYGFFKRALLGSVSHDCAKQVKCPMVVVKQPKSI